MFEEYERELEDTEDERYQRLREREEWEEEQADRDFAERGIDD